MTGTELWAMNNRVLEHLQAAHGEEEGHRKFMQMRYIDVCDLDRKISCGTEKDLTPPR